MSERDSENGNRGNKPVEVMRDGALRLAIFRNESERGESYAMVPSRTYTDEKTGKARDASSLSGSEPLRMAHLLTKGHDRVNEFRANERKERKASKDRDDERER
jgi:hypothetical protein